MSEPTKEQTNEKQLVKPPQATTQMVAPKKVKIQAVRDIMIRGVQLAPGQEAEVTEAEAEEICQTYQGNYAFGGERSEQDSPRHQIVRAKIVA